MRRKKAVPKSYPTSYTAREVADMLKISIRRVRGLIEEKRIPGATLSRRGKKPLWLIPKDFEILPPRNPAPTVARWARKRSSAPTARFNFPKAAKRA